MANTGAGAVVLFDGMCGFCSASVVFILERDNGRFLFAAQQSDVGRRTMQRFALDPGALDTLVLVEGGKCWTRSTAALRIARRLRGAWPLVYGLIVVPRPLRDAVYTLVARNRYRWFGRNETCFVPSEAQRGRFLERDTP